MDSDLKTKYRDSRLYEYAESRAKKPIYYLILISASTLSDASFSSNRALVFDVGYELWPGLIASFMAGTPPRARSRPTSSSIQASSAQAWAGGSEATYGVSGDNLTARCRASWWAKRSVSISIQSGSTSWRTMPASPVARNFSRQQTRYDWQRYILLIERKPGALRNGAPFDDMPGRHRRAELLAWIGYSWGKARDQITLERSPDTVRSVANTERPSGKQTAWVRSRTDSPAYAV